MSREADRFRRILDDPCITLFAGCDAVWNLPFQTGAAAALAAQALLAPVFVDGDS